MKKVFPSEKIIKSFQSKEQLDVFVSGVKITLRFYPFPPQYPLVKYQKVPLLSIKDIAAAKAFAIGQRAAYRDYVDMYYILKGGYATLHEVILLSEKKYATDFNGRLFLEQLVYLGDITDTKVEFLGVPIAQQAIVRRLKKEVRDYVKALV
ncbi:MAG: nucleotidyl transferase AbiEii/AbiGii toxin family protein [Patescibacteria group bacterium]